jgi:hypothetical protein
MIRDGLGMLRSAARFAVVVMPVERNVRDQVELERRALGRLGKVP